MLLLLYKSLLKILWTSEKQIISIHASVANPFITVHLLSIVVHAMKSKAHAITAQTSI